MAKEAKGDYPIKKFIGLTNEQDELLVTASEIRKKSPTFLMREFIENGARSVVDDYKNPTD